MSRPPHIAPLDEALDKHLADLREAEARQADVLTRYADAIRAVEAAQKARADAYYAAQKCESAIRDLGYVVLKPGGGTVPANASRLDAHSGSFTEAATTTKESA